MKIINVGRREVLVDDDFELPEGCHLKFARRGYVDIYKYLGMFDGKPKRQHSSQLHRYIMGCTKGDGKTIDHIDGDKLNNQRSNLRFCTTSQNGMNRKVKGYHWDKTHKKWRALIMVNYKPIFLGYFTSESDAKQAYDDAQVLYFGDFARI